MADILVIRDERFPCSSNHEYDLQEFEGIKFILAEDSDVPHLLRQKRWPLGKRMFRRANQTEREILSKNESLFVHV